MILSARPVRLRRALCAGAMLLALVATPALAQMPGAPVEPPPLPEVSDDYRKAIRAYLESQGQLAKIGESVAFQVANETLMMIAQSGAQVTEQMQQIVIEEAQSAYTKKFSDLDYLTTIWAPVYRQHFDLDEVKKMTAWFTSDLGKKIVSTSPDINQRGMFEIQKASVATSPEFQLAVDARFREAGLVQEAPPAQQ